MQTIILCFECNRAQFLYYRADAIDIVDGSESDAVLAVLHAEDLHVWWIIGVTLGVDSLQGIKLNLIKIDCQW